MYYHFDDDDGGDGDGDAAAAGNAYNLYRLTIISKTPLTNPFFTWCL